MKTLSPLQSELIDGLSKDEAVALSPAMFEKDVLLTDALRAITRVNVQDLYITFSGASR
jgi:hypothetical protein